MDLAGIRSCSRLTLYNIDYAAGNNATEDVMDFAKAKLLSSSWK